MLVALMWAVILQPTMDRASAAIVFTSAAVVHEMLLSSLDGFSYYGSAALFDLIVILILTIIPVTRLSIRLQVISFVSAILNFIGWVMWTLYLPPDWYNAAFIVLYGVSAFVLSISGGGDDVGNRTLDRRRSGIRRDDSQGRSIGAGVQGKL